MIDVDIYDGSTYTVAMNYTLDRLLAEANKRIDDSGLVVPRRVERFINIRTFRMYRARGLVSKPQAGHGRNSTYGERHLHELLTVKMLQAKWMPLGEIKDRITNTNADGLRQIIAGQLPPVSSRPSTSPPSRVWVQVKISEHAYAMIEYGYMKRLNKPAARALADRLAAGLLEQADNIAEVYHDTDRTNVRERSHNHRR